MLAPTLSNDARFPAAAPIPSLSFPLSSGGEVTVGGNRGHWMLLVVYRGKHCPRCKTYLNRLDELKAEWEAAGFELLAVSADTAQKAAADIAEFGWRFPVAHSMTEPQMRALGLYVSDPASDAETDRRFAEPGVFCVRPDGTAHIISISNGPSARPDLAELLSGMKFVIEKGRSPRGQA